MSNIDIRISADTADLEAKFAVARAQASQLTRELNTLAREASTSGNFDQMRSQLDAAAQQMLTAKSRVTELKAELGSGRGSWEGFARSIGIAREALGAFAGIGIGLSVGGFIESIEHTAELGADLQKLSAETGVSVETLSGWQYAASQMDVSAEALNTSILRLGRSVQEALTTPTSTAAEAFNALGISQDFLRENSNNLEAILRKIADAFQSHAAGANADAIAMAVLGRGGAELIPLLQQGSAGLDEMRAKSDALGATLSGETAEAMHKHVQAVKDMEAAWGGLWREVQGPLEDFATSVAHGLTQTVTWIEKLGNAIRSIPKLGAGQLLSDLQFAGPDTLSIFHGAETTGLPGFPLPSAQQKPELPSLQHPERQGGGGGGGVDHTRQIADETLRIWEETSLERIAGEEKTNQSLLQLGQESIDQFQATQQQLEEARYQVQLGYLQARIAADKGNDVALTADMGDLQKISVEHENRLNEIAQAGAEKRLQIQKDEFAKQQEAALSAFSAELDARRTADEQEIQQIQRDEQFYAEIKQQEIEASRAAMREIGSIEDTLVTDILTKRQSLGIDLAQIWDRLVIQEIQADLKWATQHLLLNSLVADSDKTTAQQGMLVKLASWAAGSDALKGLFSSQVLADAKLAAANAYAAVSSVPYVGPFLAPAAAAGAFAAVAAYDSFAVGTEFVPRTGLAMIHEGERIVPRASNEALTTALTGGSAGGRGGSTVNFHYNPVIHEAGGKLDLSEHSREIGRIFNDLVRDGYVSRVA
jgi:hypothetical protein